MLKSEVVDIFSYLVEVQQVTSVDGFVVFEVIIADFVEFVSVKVGT